MTPTPHACCTDRGAIQPIEIHVSTTMKVERASVLTARPPTSPIRGIRTASRAAPLIDATTSSAHQMRTARKTIVLLLPAQIFKR